MDANEKQLISEFFAVASKLNDAGIVRSDKLLGDIGEWLCVKTYGLVLAESGRNTGFDGCIGDNKTQVKVHNAPIGTNISVGNPDKYDELIILIGPRSRLRNTDNKLSFHVYRFSSNEVRETMKQTSGFYCAKGTLEDKQYDAISLEA
jgi:hypothetical protein